MCDEIERILTLDDSCIFQTKYEGVGDFKKSIFKEVYFEAYNSLIDIVNTQERLKDKNIKPRNFDANNIIAFVGDRGSGKTSCMRNFRRSLKKDDNRSNERVEFYKAMLSESKLEKSKWKDVLEKRYEILTVIDPSLFSIKDSLTEIVVAQMFNRFKDNCNNEESSFSNKQSLVKQFEKVYKDISIINTNKDSIYNGNYDNLEALVALSSAISLKDDMSELVKEYIRFMSKEKEGYLVISIDDIDMNLHVGEKMLEDIRKYLIIPNVIILIAVKMEQLKQIIQQRYLVYLKDNELLEKEIDNIYIEKNKYSTLLEKFKKDIKNKTDKYLEKIIPYNRRIKLSNLKHTDKVEINSKDLKNLFNLEYEAEEKIKKDNDEFKVVEIDKFISKIIVVLSKELDDEYKKIYLVYKDYENLRKFIEFVVLANKIMPVEKKK